MSENNNSNSPIAVLSVLLAIILLGICIVYIINGPFSQKEPASLQTAKLTDSTNSSTQKRDTIVNEKNEKIITITNSSIIKTTSAPPAESKDDTAARLDTLLPYFILLFSIFIIIMTLPRIKKLALKKDGIDIDLAEMAKEFNEAQQATVEEVGGPPPATEDGRKLATKDFQIGENVANTDPQAGRWGGKDENNHRKVVAKIKRIANTDIAEITLVVMSTDPVKHPLTGAVQFHLHPTFLNSTPVIFALKGRAELRLQAWGAFTVGVEADKGATRLELNLEKQPGSFEPFKSR